MLILADIGGRGVCEQPLIRPVRNYFPIYKYLPPTLPLGGQIKIASSKDPQKWTICLKSGNVHVTDEDEVARPQWPGWEGPIMARLALQSAGAKIFKGNRKSFFCLNEHLNYVTKKLKIIICVISLYECY